MVLTTTAPRPLSWSLHCLAVLLLAPVLLTQAYSVQYCSPDLNNDANEISSIYMSNGKCQQNCLGSYVFAIVQGDYCWCSNDVPSSQVDLSQCNSQCPGWQQDMCGNPTENLYGYINIGGIPSGTAGGSSSPSSTLSSSSSRGTGSSATPSTYVTTVTGKATTVLVTPTATGSQGSALGDGVQAAGHSSGLNGGQVAGIVIGCALGIGLLIGLIVFLWLRHKHQKNITAMSEHGSYTSPSSIGKSGNGIPSRQVSQMSSAGLLTRPLRMNTGGLSNSEDPRSAGAGSLNDRSSTHMAVDQRLNPWAIYSNDESRQSNVSLQDNQDYSRQLRVANPDP